MKIPLIGHEDENQFEYYGNAMQITVRNQAIIYDLDSGVWNNANNELEVDYIENMEQFVDPDKFINTGFENGVSTSLAAGI